MKSSFTPFLISEIKTGLFNYTEPWIRPVDAFDPLSNAFVYRGSVHKRQGFNIFGRMPYRDNNVALGNGGHDYSGTLAIIPIVAGSFSISDGIETFTDNGNGTLTGSAGGTGTINYMSGVWSVHFNAVVASNTNIFATYQPNVSRPIMGLKQWESEADGSRTLIAFDTRRAARYNNGTNAFEPIDTVSQVLWVGDNSTTSISFTTGWVAVAPYADVFAPFSISITDGTSTIVDDGAGNLSASGNFAAGGTVNYATGVIDLNFTAATTATITLTALLSGDYFTGTPSNFFNATNWIAPFYYDTNPGFLYVTNNADPITAYDGTNLTRPPFPITQAHAIAFINHIKFALDVDVYKNRFLVQRPTLVGSSNPAAQSIRWSALNSPTNLVADVTGNGGELSAPTNDFMQSSEFLRDQLIVLFANSTWTFRFTGSDFNPFRFDKINNSKSTNAPYGTVDYDERVTAIGSKGLIACDGVNVQRYDNSIIDQFLDINQNRFFQCFGLRFDTLNQTWMLYPDKQTKAILSTKILVYNFIENTWSTYDLPLSCLGTYFITSDKSWVDFSPTSANPTSWNQAEFSWDSYLLQNQAPTLLGGSVAGGYIYQMNYNEFDELNFAIQLEVTNTGTGATTYTGMLGDAPIIPGTLTITDGVETFTDNGDGTLTRTPVAGGTNTINYVTGAYSITFNSAVATGIQILANYTAIAYHFPIEASITSARWNPFTEQGQKVQFGYIDVYYEINTPCVLDITFFIDNGEEPATTRQLTLDGPTNSDVAFKRIYINIVGEFLRMNIYNNQAEDFKILGMILWASPSGRLTPGKSVT